jgi:hypothetical protein
MHLDGGSRWTNPQNNDAIVIFETLYDVSMTPKEAIWDEFGKIIEIGGDVEYGEFFSKYLAEAYYVKYVMEENINIYLYFFFFPQDVYAQLPYGSQPITTLNYKNRIDLKDFEASMDEDTFWKAAQSIFFSKGYPGPIPYIPDIDGENIWDGSNQGEVLPN